MKSNKLPFFIGILALVLIGAIWYFASNKKTETTVQKTAPQKTPTQTNQNPITLGNKIADWKTYSNTKYGFTFQYPKEWKSPTVSKEPDPEVLSNIFFGPMVSCCNGGDVDSRSETEQFMIAVYKPQQEAKALKLVSGDIESDSNISGNRIVVYSTEGGNLFFPKGAWIFAKNYTLHFEATYGSRDQNVSQQFDQILSSFTFTQ